MRIILASQSPRRRELLQKIVDRFEVIPSLSDEKSTAAEPDRFATEVSAHKAWDVYAQNHDALVIGCDTVVDLDGKILGKPKTPDGATSMLNSLSGKTHKVHTGVCVIYDGKAQQFCETTLVTFRNLSAGEIAAYVQSGAPMDKAGAYGIQECDFVENYVGSYDNVMGLPTERLKKILEQYKR